MVMNGKVKEFVYQSAALLKPDTIHWCDGTDEEYQLMLRLMIQAGTAIPVNPEKRPQQRLHSVRSRRCGSGRGIYLYLFRAGRRRGTHEQLARTR